MTESEAKAIRWIGNIRDDTVIVKEELLDNNAMCCNILPHIIRQEKNINAEIFINAISELDKYRAIGTVEECREVMERQRAKKPLKYETHEDYDDGICPNCKVPVNDVFGYCTDCGQSLLWEHDDE